MLRKLMEVLFDLLLVQIMEQVCFTIADLTRMQRCAIVNGHWANGLPCRSSMFYSPHCILDEICPPVRSAPGDIGS